VRDRHVERDPVHPRRELAEPLVVAIERAPQLGRDLLLQVASIIGPAGIDPGDLADDPGEQAFEAGVAVCAHRDGR